jgi:thiol-disulfide isomerase/thioredoxin
MHLNFRYLIIFLLLPCLNIKAEVFTGLNQAKLLYGKKIKQEDLKGKVVFFEYWGIYCPPCRDSIPHLVSLQKQYESTGKFTVIASHVGKNLDKQAKDFLKANNVNFPVYQDFYSSQAPGGTSIPHAFIINQNGKIVAEGHPAELYTKIKAIIDSAPNPPPGALKGLKLQYWQEIESKVKAGKPYATIFIKLNKEALKETPKGREAKEIVAKIKENVEIQFEDLKKKSETMPLNILKKLKPFIKQTKGMKVGAKAGELYKILYSDINLKKIISMQKEIDKIIRKMHGHRSRSLIKKSKVIKQKLSKITADANASERAKTAAENLIKHIDNNI